MANTVTSNELNVVQGFGERQLLRTTDATVTPGMLLVLGTDGNWDLAADDSTGVLCIAQNSSANLDAKGTNYDFVGVDAMVIGIPVNSGAEVEIPADALAADYVAVLNAPVYAAADGLVDDDGSIVIGYVTDSNATSGSVTVLLG